MPKEGRQAAPHLDVIGMCLAPIAFSMLAYGVSEGVMHYSALETGWILMPYALCAAIGMPISGRLFDKIGARPLAFAGLAVVSISLFILSGIRIV